MRAKLFFAFCLLIQGFEASPRRFDGEKINLINSDQNRWGGGSRSSGRSSWGGFGRRRSSSSSSSSSGWARQGSPSSYPRQTMGSSYPRQTVGSRTGGSGGFAKPQSPSVGGTAGSYGSRGLGGGGFVAPKPISRGTYSAPGGRTFGSATPGHGTSWGTSFPSGVGK